MLGLPSQMRLRTQGEFREWERQLLHPTASGSGAGETLHVSAGLFGIFVFLLSVRFPLLKLVASTRNHQI